MNKKANILDHHFVLVMLFSIVLTVIIFGVIIHYINQAYSNIDSSLAPTEYKNQIAKIETKSQSSFDYAFLIALFMFTFLSIFAASKIRTSPLFMVIAIIYIFVTLGLSIFVSYMFVQLSTSNAVIVTSLQSLPIISYIMPRLVFFSIINNVIIGIVLYAKPE